MNRSRLDATFKEKNIEAIISENPNTRQWFTSISTTDGLLIIEPKNSTLFVDGRYFEYANKNAKNVKVVLLNKENLNDFFSKKKFKKIAIEFDCLTIENFVKFKELTNLKSKDIVYINSQDLRIIKSNDEIKYLQNAIDISLKSYDKLLESYVKIGITELELAHKLEYIMKRFGADKEGFDSIVAFGPNSAMPHHHPTDTKLKNGDIVKIDFGAKYKGYVADITRTFIYSDDKANVAPKIDEKLKTILEIVEEAAKRGRAAVKPGIKASEIDNICREYIKSKGYSNFFVHSTGHGIGLDVHEKPVVSQNSDYVLEEGMVITVEPGIYIEGIGGARIEDDVLVTKTGHKVLSRKQEKKND